MGMPLYSRPIAGARPRRTMSLQERTAQRVVLWCRSLALARKRWDVEFTGQLENWPDAMRKIREEDICINL